MLRPVTLLISLALAGCAPAKLVFGGPRSDDRALTFYDPLPHLLVTVAEDCTITSKVVAIPGKERSVRLDPGRGAGELSVGFADGLITSVGQKSDTKVPEAIGGVAGLAAAIGGIVKPAFVPAEQDKANAIKKPACVAEAHLFPIGSDGNINTDESSDKLRFKPKKN